MAGKGWRGAVTQYYDEQARCCRALDYAVTIVVSVIVNHNSLSWEN